MTRIQIALMIIAVCLALAIVGILFVSETPKVPIDGIACDSMEGKALHFHVQLQIWHNGKPVELPPDVGRSAGCAYWLHTHTSDGIVHIESPVVRTFTLGEFFDIWGRNPFGDKRSVHDEKGIRIWVRKEGETSFHELVDGWQKATLTPHQILVVGTGQFLPHDFKFPEGL